MRSGAVGSVATPPALGGLRLLRGCVPAVACAWLAAFAHGLGGGHRPSAVAVLLAAALCAAVGVNLSARRVGVLRAALTLAPVQLAAHLLFTIFTPTEGRPAAGASAPGTHSHHPSGGVPTPDAVTTAHAAAPLRMLLLHAAAVVLTAVLLAHGDRAVLALVGWLTAVLGVAQAFGSVPPRRVASRAPAGPFLPRTPGHRWALSRRGPPLAGHAC